MELYLPEAYALNVLKPRLEDPTFYPRNNSQESFLQRLDTILNFGVQADDIKDFLQQVDSVRIPTGVKSAIKTYVQCMNLVNEYNSDSNKVIHLIEEIEDGNINKDLFYEEALTLLLNEINSVYSLNSLSDYAGVLEKLDSKKQEIAGGLIFLQVASSIEVNDDLINMAKQLKCFINLIKISGCSVLLKSLAQDFFILLDNDQMAKSLPDYITADSLAFNNYNQKDILKALKMIREVPFDDVTKEKYQKYCKLYNVVDETKSQELETKHSSDLDSATIALARLNTGDYDVLLNLPITSWDQIKEIDTIVSIPEKKPPIKIMRCEIIIDGKPLLVAVKTYTMKAKDTSLEVQAGYMAKLQGFSNFLALYGSFWSIANNVFSYNLVMELAEESLTKRILSWEAQGKDSNFREEQALTALKALVSGMYELNNRNIAHRDIKPDNILIAKGGIYKISDLDISKEFSRDNYGRTCSTGNARYEGTKDYMSPELRSLETETGPKTGDINYNKSDVYSLGLTIMRMVTKEGVGAFCTMSRFLENNLKDHLNTSIKNDTLRNYLIEMLKVNPNHRPRFQELYNKLSLEDKTAV